MPRSPRFTERLERLIESRHVLPGVFIASMLETTIVPVPIEIVLIPAMLTNPLKRWLIATTALAGCLAGASVGYLIGFGFYESVGEPLVGLLGATETFEEYRGKIEEKGFTYVLLISITPVPFQIAYLGAGVVKMNFLTFLAAAALGRGIRYFGLAVLVAILGRAAGDWLQRNKHAIAIWATVIFIGGYVGYQLIA